MNSLITFEQAVRVLGAQKIGGEWRAPCPAHGGTDANLCIKEERGTLFLTCMSRGCSFESIIAAIRKSGGMVEHGSEKFEYRPEQAQTRIGEAAKYLASRGIPLDLAKERRLGVVEHPELGKTLSIPYDAETPKFRSLNPPHAKAKFKHLFGRPTADRLYGVERLQDPNAEQDTLLGYRTTGSIYITESELDALTVEAQTGRSALSVSSATACIEKYGTLKIRPEHLKVLEDADKIFLCFDQDEAGQNCARAFEKILPEYKTSRVRWGYKDHTDPKDVGELYAQDPATFAERFESLCREAELAPPEWRRQVKSVSQMQTGALRFLIKDFLPEGICFLGAPSGDGKTWLALSMAKALSTGKKFLGRFEVPEPVNVLYLIPESGERAFRARLEKMHMPEDHFLCQTMNDEIWYFGNPLLLQAVRSLKPVIFLDTVIRFSTAADENSASQNRAIQDGFFELRRAGAPAVVALHHSPKATATANFLTLENVLRGTGDLGALADAVYGLRMGEDDADKFEVVCVKPRDFAPPAPFTAQLRYRDSAGALHSFLDEAGDLALLASCEAGLPHDDKMREAFQLFESGGKTLRTVADALDVSKSTVARWREEWEKRRSSEAPEATEEPSPF